MKKFHLGLLSAIFILFTIPVTVRAAYEPPHFSDPVVNADCYECHLPHHSLASYPALLGKLCQDCHFDGGPATGVFTHSSRTTDDGYGDWDLDCWACHNPHTQEQESWLSTTYGKYIRRYMNGVEIKEINPLDPGPYYFEPTTIIRRVTSDIVEFKSQTEFVDGDGVANDDICQVCHQLTSFYNTGANLNVHADYGVDSQPGGNCTSCHKHTDGFKASGGHADPDLIVTESTNCTTCHNGTVTGTWTPVPDIHSNNCSLCHVDSAGSGPLWEPWETNNTNGGDCEDCHNGGVAAPDVADKASIHHNFKYAATGSKPGVSGNAPLGQCIACHMPDIDGTGPIANRGDISMPDNLACNYCHLYFAGFAADPDNNTGYVTSGSKVQVYSNTFNPNTNFGRLPSVAPVATHTISEANPPVSDYGACFACHGGSTFAGTGGDSTPIEPLHGLGTAYTGDSLTLGGDINDVINAYAGPQVEMVWGENGSAGDANNPVKQVPYHPGWTNLNWLACNVGLNCGNTKPYNHNDSPGWHPDDLGLYDPTLPTPGNVGVCTNGNFNIPWDTFTGGDPGAPTTISNKDFGWKGTANVSTNVPLVPLGLTSGNCSLWDNAAINQRVGSGTNGTNKNGALSQDGYAYVDHNAPYPISAPNNGTVTSVYWQKIDTDGTITIFTCTPNTTPNPTSCTITASNDYSVADGTATTVSLPIKPGDMVGYWHSGGGVVDKSNNDPTPLGNGPIRRTAGTVSKPAATNLLNIGPDPIGDFANFGATVNAQPY